MKFSNEITENIGSGLHASLANLEKMVKERMVEAAVSRPSANIQKANLIEEMLHAANVPKRHLSLKPSCKDVSGDWGALDTRIAGRQGTGFMLAIVGIHGCGKTQLGVEAIRRCVVSGMPGLYVTAMDFFMDIKATYRANAQLSEKDVIKAYRKPKMLVLDEIGKRSETQWEQNLLFDLLDKRYGDMSDTILIANMTREDFVKSIGTSLASRIDESGGIKDCSQWKSFRKK